MHRSRRLRLAAGLTLLVPSLFWFGAGGVFLWQGMNPPDPTNDAYALIAGAALGLILVVAVPGLLAAIGLLRGHATGGLLGGLYSLAMVVFVGSSLVNLIGQSEELAGPDAGARVQALLLAMGGLTAAYCFAGIAALLTIHARDEARPSAAA